MGEPSSEGRSSSAPSRVGRYELLRAIGRGGTATVYLARDTNADGRLVALKLVHPHLREELEVVWDFLEEARLAASLDHPNIVPVLDLGECADGIFLVMEYFESVTLSSLARRCLSEGLTLGPDIALRVLSDALRGLQHAHELCGSDGKSLGVVHRDFSPQNILVGTDGASRLVDFGIARALNRPSFTRTGLIKGKAGYMAPEQVVGDRLDARCDIWAAGVVAWELFAGRALFQGEDLQKLYAIASGTPPLLRAVAPNVPEAVEAVIAKALAKAPSDRFSSAEEFEDALSRAWQPAVFAADPLVVAHQVIAARDAAPPSQPLPSLSVRPRPEVPSSAPAATKRRRENSGRGVAFFAAGVTLAAAIFGSIALALLHRPAAHSPTAAEASASAAAPAPVAAAPTGASAGERRTGGSSRDLPTGAASAAQAEGRNAPNEPAAAVDSAAEASTVRADGGGPAQAPTAGDEPPAAESAPQARAERASTPLGRAATADPRRSTGTSTGFRPARGADTASAARAAPARGEQRLLRIRANGAMSTVRIGTRELRVQPSSERFVVTLNAMEARSRPEVEVVAADGRRLHSRVPPQGDLELRFPALPGAPPALPLAENPYGR